MDAQPLLYDSPAPGPLHQGEILRSVDEECVVTGASELRRDTIHHPLVVVLNSECDLHFDYKARFREGEPVDPREALGDPKSIPYVFLVDLHEDSKQSRELLGMNAAIWKRAKSNQDERRHSLSEGTVGPDGESLPLLIADFKKTFSMPTQLVYDKIDAGEISRVCVVPPIFIHQLTQRFYAFHGRVGLPDATP